MCRCWALLLLVAWLGLVSADGPNVQPVLPPKVENFTLEDVEGRRWTLYDLKDLRAVVLYFTATECPLANRYIQRVNQLSATFVRKGVIVLAINPNGLETVEQIRRHQKETGLAVNVLLDREQRVADQLKVEVTPTVIVVDADWRVRYRGLFDDSKIGGHVKTRYVAEAVAALVDGRDVAVPETKPWGCMVQRALKETQTDITYAGQVAPLLAKHCVACHRPAGDAPFALTTYDEARRWAGTMKEFTRLGVMPPWKPVNPKTFHGERFLAATDVATIAQWVDGGTPRGTAAQALDLPKSPAGWALGEPDLVLTAPAYEIAGHGDDQFRCFVLPTSLPGDVWLRAVDVRPGNRRVAHHVIPYIDTAGAAAKLDSADPKPGYQGSGGGPGFTPSAELDGWAPGKAPHPLPEGVGARLPKGAHIVLEVHYHPTGRVENDQTRIGLYFATTPIEKTVHQLEIANRAFLIPAGKERHTVTAEHALAEDIEVLTLRPHMHYLGRAIKVEAQYPDQRRRRTLLHITNWDFHWQETYHFQERVPLPRGTRLVVAATYDNSATNPANPHILPRAVGPGAGATDERCAVSITYTKNAENLRPAGKK